MLELTALSQYEKEQYISKINPTPDITSQDMCLKNKAKCLRSVNFEIAIYVKSNGINHPREASLIAGCNKIFKKCMQKVGKPYTAKIIRTMSNADIRKMAIESMLED